MNGNAQKLIKYLDGASKRFIIPVYQRNYDARTKIHLQNYLENRSDSNPALFVSLASPHERLQIGGI